MINSMDVSGRQKGRATKMSGTEKAHNSNLAKRWMISIGIFIIVQIFFSLLMALFWSRILTIVTIWLQGLEDGF